MLPDAGAIPTTGFFEGKQGRWHLGALYFPGKSKMKATILTFDFEILQ